MTFTKFVIQPKKPDPNQLLTSFQAPQVAQASQSFQPKTTQFILTPEAQARGAALPISRGGLAPEPTKLATTTKTSTKPAFNNAAALAGLQRQATGQNALNESQQQI